MAYLPKATAWIGDYDKGVARGGKRARASLLLPLILLFVLHLHRLLNPSRLNKEELEETGAGAREGGR